MSDFLGIPETRIPPVPDGFPALDQRTTLPMPPVHSTGPFLNLLMALRKPLHSVVTADAPPHSLESRFRSCGFRWVEVGTYASKADAIRLGVPVVLQALGEVALEPNDLHYFLQEEASGRYQMFSWDDSDHS